METVLDYVVILPGLIMMMLILAAGSVVVLGSLQRRGRALSRRALWRWLALILFLAMAHMPLMALLIPMPPQEPLFGLSLDGALVASALMASVELAIVAAAIPARRRRGPHRFANMALATIVRILAIAMILAALPVSIVYALWGGGSDLLLAFEVVLFVVGFAEASRQLWNLGRRLSTPDLAARLASDPRPPVFYLRPFGVEHALFVTGTDPKTFEEFLAEEIEDRVGPFVALGSPRDRVPPIGAARAYASDQQWRPMVQSLASEACCILGLVASSGGLKWELNYLHTQRLQSKLFLCTPPTTLDTDDALSGTESKSLWKTAGRLLEAWTDEDPVTVARILSFRRRVPEVYAWFGDRAWNAAVAELEAAGYTVSIDVPEPGSVITFDCNCRARIVGTGATTASDYIDLVLAGLAHRTASQLADERPKQE